VYVLKNFTLLMLVCLLDKLNSIKIGWNGAISGSIKSKMAAGRHLRKFKWSMGHLMHIMFVSRVGFSELAYRVLNELNPRGSYRPSWKIWNEYVFGMGYLIHFHETESSFVGIWATIMRED